MTETEKYLFDLQGYLLVDNALAPEQLQTLNQILDQQIEALKKPELTTHRFGNLLKWGQPYIDLLDNPRLLTHLDEIIGKNFRLDHTYLDIIRSGLSPIGATLHGGATPFDPGQYFHFAQGRMYNGLTVLAYNLADVNPGDGGFACIPGSHKSNFPLPKEFVNLDNMHACVKNVTGPKGSAVIFTEALTHGPLPWKGKHERRTIFFKFCPHSFAWGATYPSAKDYTGLTPRQAAMLEAPNARYQGR